MKTNTTTTIHGKPVTALGLIAQGLSKQQSAAAASRLKPRQTMKSPVLRGKPVTPVQLIAAGRANHSPRTGDESGAVVSALHSKGVSLAGLKKYLPTR